MTKTLDSFTPGKLQGKANAGSTKKAKEGKYDKVERKSHSWFFSLINSRSTKPQAQWYKRCMLNIVLFDVAMYVLSTVPEFRSSQGWFRFFRSSEHVVAVLFLIDYILRVTVICESRRFRHPIWGRLRYVFSTSALIDAASTIPGVLELLEDHTPFKLFDILSALKITDPGSCIELPRTTPLKVLRIFRILRTEKYARAVEISLRILWFNREILTAAFLICSLLILATSTMLYHFPPPASYHSPAFQSIPSTMYLAILMLTGQGLEADGPLPWYTKAVIIATAIFSVAMFAIPSSMITWGFEAEAARMARKAKELRRKRNLKPGAVTTGALKLEGKTTALATNEALSDESGSSSGFSDSQASQASQDSWAEYEDIIAGSDASEEALEAEQAMSPRAADLDEFDDAIDANSQSPAVAHSNPKDGDVISRDINSRRFRTLQRQIDQQNDHIKELSSKLDHVIGLLSKEASHSKEASPEV